MQNLKFGGAEKVLCTFLKNFDRNKYKVDLVLHSREGELLKEVPKDVSVTGIVPSDSGKFWNKAYRSIIFKILIFFPFLFRMLLRPKLRPADVTIAYMEGISTNIASVLKGPKVAWVHTDVEKNPWADSFFYNNYEEERSYKKMDKIVFVSEGGKSAFNNKFNHIDLTREIVIHNPIDKKSIKKLSQITDVNFNKWNLQTKDTIRIITVGRLDPVKRMDVILKGFIKLPRNNRRFSLTVIGDGAEYINLKKLVRGIDNVFFVGFQKNPFSYVAKCDLFISTSRVESYPTAIIESLILGTPVLATRNAGSIEVLGKSSLFLLNTDINPTQLKGKILNIIKSPDCIVNKEKYIGQKFDISKILDNYYRVFEEVSRIDGKN